ncbi:MAG: transcriptional regulator [Candidatus Saccharibacteria bacterium]
MIDALFGSKTRVKLLHLFLNNPNQSFYVREITRKIEEQINSVRRELLNMLEIGIISSDSSDNKLYYKVNQRYEYFVPLRAIFGGTPINDDDVSVDKKDGNYDEKYLKLFSDLTGLRLAILTGVLVVGSNTDVDILLVGNVSPSKIKTIVKNIEKSEGREINYSVLTYDEFYYRLSVRDRFITEIMNGNHNVLIDKDKVINKVSGEK